MNRRDFVLLTGAGLLGSRGRVWGAQDDFALRVALESPPWPQLPGEEPAPTMPVHWQTTHNRTWKWVQREHYLDGEWLVTGMTRPVRRDNGEPLEGVEGYLDDGELPENYRDIYAGLVDANGDPLAPADDDGVATLDDAPGPDAIAARRGRHGRPPSRWLLSLSAADAAVWLATVDPPEAGVDGFTFEEHLTRDHGFLADRITGLTEYQLAKLHAAAHHGY